MCHCTHNWQIVAIVALNVHDGNVFIYLCLFFYSLLRKSRYSIGGVRVHPRTTYYFKVKIELATSPSSKTYCYILQVPKSTYVPDGPFGSKHANVLGSVPARKLNIPPPITFFGLCCTDFLWYIAICASTQLTSGFSLLHLQQHTSHLSIRGISVHGILPL